MKIVLAYQGELKAANPKRSGTQTLRNEIMQDFDYKGDALIRSDLFTKGDLDAWMFRGVRLGPHKFQYIDQFVRKFQGSTQYDAIAGLLIDAIEARHRKIFSELYVCDNNSVEPSVDRDFSALVGRVFVSTPLENLEVRERSAVLGPEHRIYEAQSTALRRFRQIFILPRRVEKGIASVNVIYSDRVLSEIRPELLHGSYAVAFGYLIPTHPKPERWAVRGLLKIFRLEAKGMYAGSGYSSSSFTIRTRNPNHFDLGWDEQIASSDLTGESGQKPPIEIAGIDEEDPHDHDIRLSKNGILKFREPDFDTSKLIDFMKSLTNRYLIW